MLAELTVSYETNFDIAAERKEYVEVQRTAHWSL